MLWRSSVVSGFGIEASNGAIGSISDLLFDDTNWALRWCVVDTGSWLSGRKVLLPPSAMGEPDSSRRSFMVKLTRQQVEDSPVIDADAPVSRQLEASVYGYYGWSPYWYPGYGMAMMGALPAAQSQPPSQTQAHGYRADGTDPTSGDPHLRSANEIIGYNVRASDDDIGHVEELLVDIESWEIRYFVVDTKNWWPGKKVLVAPQWFLEVSWAEKSVHVSLTRDQVKKSPEYDASATADRAYEDRLYQHYGYQRY